MTINDSVLQNSERIIFALRELYARYGYAPYRMSKFEEYDLYARNKDFLVSDQVITFTDTNGKLMALKPDVTLSIIKNSKDLPGELQKVFYNENVYRVAGGSRTFRELPQAGLECFGRVGEENVCEVISLAVRSLLTLSDDCVLAISDLDLLQSAVGELGVPAGSLPALYKAVSERNLHEIRTLARDGAPPEAVDRLLRLIGVRGTAREALPLLRSAMGSRADGGEGGRFLSVLEKLARSGDAGRIQIDLSVVGDANYYNGIVFRGFVKGVPVPVLSGGQYDRLMRKLQRRSGAVGFAVYLDALEYLQDGRREEAAEPDGGALLNIALPKGRLGERVYDMFEKAGFPCPAIRENSRKLIFESGERGVRYFWVKPSDVAIYVERGAADIGVAGKDILLEYEPDVYELLDLGVGRCRMAVAGKRDFRDDPARTLRVATKFPNIAGSYYRAKGRDIDVIRLNGSIELAPILGLSDVIVDIVETGTTLRENDLTVLDTVAPVSARLIANKTSYKFKSAEIDRITNRLSERIQMEKTV